MIKFYEKFNIKKINVKKLDLDEGLKSSKLLQK